MIQIHIENKKKPEIYRKLLLPMNSSFFLLDETILLSFDLDGPDYFDFEMVKKMDEYLNKTFVFHLKMLRI